jgi:hypothetical protein
MCLTGIDDENRIATFAQGTLDGEEVKLAIQGQKMLEKLQQAGLKSCGLLKTGRQPMCTDFEKEPDTPRQSGK